MKFHYYPETDSLYIELTERDSVDSQEASPGVVLDYDSDGVLVGIDIDHASTITDVSGIVDPKSGKAHPPIIAGNVPAPAEAHSALNYLWLILKRFRRSTRR